MLESTLRSPLANLRATIQAIDVALLQNDLPLSGMEDLKSAVDDVRLRLWATISASHASDSDGVLLRFRLRRAHEICRGVEEDLRAGTLGDHQRELLELREAAGKMIERISASLRGSV